MEQGKEPLAHTITQTQFNSGSYIDISPHILDSSHQNQARRKLDGVEVEEKVEGLGTPTTVSRYTSSARAGTEDIDTRGKDRLEPTFPGTVSADPSSGESKSSRVPRQGIHAIHFAVGAFIVLKGFGVDRWIGWVAAASPNSNTLLKVSIEDPLVPAHRRHGSGRARAPGAVLSLIVGGGSCNRPSGMHIYTPTPTWIRAQPGSHSRGFSNCGARCVMDQRGVKQKYVEPVPRQKYEQVAVSRADRAEKLSTASRREHLRPARTRQDLKAASGRQRCLYTLWSPSRFIGFLSRRGKTGSRSAVVGGRVKSHRDCRNCQKNEGINWVDIMMLGNQTTNGPMYGYIVKDCHSAKRMIAVACGVGRETTVGGRQG
ncbi:hypothetical protein C8R43DRAFT_953455 [Mycena crocata]|nr:hypothetical protein C8R43DRAFT_953455 [Mycena crocata]